MGHRIWSSVTREQSSLRWRWITGHTGTVSNWTLVDRGDQEIMPAMKPSTAPSDESVYRNTTLWIWRRLNRYLNTGGWTTTIPDHMVVWSRLHRPSSRPIGNRPWIRKSWQNGSRNGPRLRARAYLFYTVGWNYSGGQRYFLPFVGSTNATATLDVWVSSLLLPQQLTHNAVLNTDIFHVLITSSILRLLCNNFGTIIWKLVYLHIAFANISFDTIEQAFVGIK